MEGSNGGN
jgi:hypothetical protein